MSIIVFYITLFNKEQEIIKIMYLPQEIEIY